MKGKTLEATLQRNLEKYRKAGKTADWLRSYERKFRNPSSNRSTP
jgi:hypothetical protein